MGGSDRRLRRLLRIALPALVARFQHGGSHRGARPPHRVQILRQEAPRQRPLQDPLHPRTERREEYGQPYPEKAKDEEMSGPPYALQRLPAIINFSGGMQGMIFGDIPDFGWVMEQLQRAEAAINRT